MPKTPPIHQFRRIFETAAAYINDTHSSNSSHVYGSGRSARRTARAPARGQGGASARQRLRHRTRSPAGWARVSSGACGSGSACWVGLALGRRRHLRQLGEHDAASRTMSALPQQARLRDAALLAKFHAVEVGQPPSCRGTSRLLRLELVRFVFASSRTWPKLFADNDIFCRITSSQRARRRPISLTRSSPRCSRMHTLIPDRCAICSTKTGEGLVRRRATRGCSARRGRVPRRAEHRRTGYSSGPAIAGAVRLHDCPKFLQNLSFQDNSERFDLGTMDASSRSPARLPLQPVPAPPFASRRSRAFEELTDRPAR